MSSLLRVLAHIWFWFCDIVCIMFSLLRHCIWLLMMFYIPWAIWSISCFWCIFFILLYRVVIVSGDVFTLSDSKLFASWLHDASLLFLLLFVVVYLLLRWCLFSCCDIYFTLLPFVRPIIYYLLAVGSWGGESCRLCFFHIVCYCTVFIAPLHLVVISVLQARWKW